MVLHPPASSHPQPLTLLQVRVRNYDRNVAVTDPTDWDDPRFGWIFVLFMLNWVFSVRSPSLLISPSLTTPAHSNSGTT